LVAQGTSHHATMADALSIEEMNKVRVAMVA
jgi:glucosamine 6-phosphate synthetase-like amidotransferase/phosphosugar isomerase protein